MPRPIAAPAIALLVLLGAVAEARAQTSVLVGLGTTIPMGTLTDSGPFTGADPGWQATIGLRRAVGSSGIALGGRAFYGANGYEGPGEQSSKLVGLTALGTWTFAGGPVSPILWSEAGFLSHRYSADSGGLLGGAEESNESAVVLAGGLGAGVPVGSVELLLIGGYSHGLGVFQDIRYLVFTVATSFAIN